MQAGPRFRSFWVTLGVLAVIGLAASRSPDSCEVTLRLIDAATEQDLPGLVAIEDESGERIAVPSLLSRGLGLTEQLGTAESPIHRWSVLSAKTTLPLPRKKLTFTAFSGLETESTRETVDLTGRARADVTIRLRRFHDAHALGQRAGNTHLHLMKISRDESDRYLTEVPRGDGLDLVFLSYLERAGADADYISNKYADGDLASLSKNSGVLFGNGEEHRHNSQGYGEGYGHVMLLNITDLVQPVSIGPGIMKSGTDGLPLQRGIDTARRQGATVVWCHNEWGWEAIPNFVTGRVHAQNIFDGGIRSSYKHSFYRYLNAGLRVPFSTGTDWFLYDFSRVYVNVDGPLTVENWLKGLAKGRSYITNGPLLEFTVNEQAPGGVISLEKAGPLRVHATAHGRIDFARIELVQNGCVVASADSNAVGGHFEATLETTLDVEEPAWLALRTPPGPIPKDPELTQAVAKNEFGADLFAHTSPIYVELGGRGPYNREIAAELLSRMEANQAAIAETSKFADDAERQRVLDVYRDGIAAMKQHMTLAGRRAE